MKFKSRRFQIELFVSLVGFATQPALALHEYDFPGTGSRSNWSKAHKLFLQAISTRKTGSYNGREQNMSAIKKAIETYPQDPSFHCELAQECLECRRYSEASEAVKQALKLHPNFGRAYYEQAQIFLKQCYNEDAIQALETSATLTPNDPDVWLALGVYREEPGSGGSPEDAYINCLKRVNSRRNLNPFNDTAESYRILSFQSLSTLRLGQKRYAEAKYFYKQAFVSDTKHQFTDRLLGEIDYCEKNISNSLTKI